MPSEDVQIRRVVVPPGGPPQQSHGAAIESGAAVVRLHASVLLDKLSASAEAFSEEPEISGPGDQAQPGMLVAGRYRLHAVLGRGAFGRVWRALDQREGRDVAIKELLDDSSDASAERFREFEQEFFTLSNLKHPNIVGALDYGILKNGVCFLVMEIVDGTDVSDLLRRGPLPRAEAARILYELVQAVELLHSRLLVHCDIKAENLRVTPAGAKLMDFGLLHQLGTPVTQVKGTPLYMAPEMLQGGVIDGRTDLYSVGVLAYELLTGQPPFVGETPLEIIRSHLETRPKPPSYYLDLPAELDALVLSLLEKDPDKRPSDAGQLLPQLAAFAGIDRAAHENVARTSYLYAAQLVGRDVERQRLRAFRLDVAGRRGASIAVAGRGGEGKTRLLEELKLQAKVDHMHWAAGQCRPELGALEPMVDALSPLLATTTDAELARFGPALSFLLPAVAARGYKFEGPPDPNQTRATVYAAVSDWLNAIAERTPVILCLEDIHWADGTTIDLYNTLVRRRTEGGVGFIATFRSNELDLAALAYATIHERRTDLIELAPLQRVHLEELLVQSLRVHDLPPTFVDGLLTASRGNPFFIVETLRASVEAGHLRRADGCWSLAASPPALPSSIAEVVERRLALLPPELRRAAEQLAPIGRFLDLGMMRTVTKQEPKALHEILGALVQRQFILREGGRHLFTHDQVRAAIYDSLADDDRRGLHQRIGEGLAQSKQMDPATVAFHYRRGVTPERAEGFFLLAARQALAKQQTGEAIRLLSEAREVLDAIPHKERRAAEITVLELLGRISTLVQPRVGVSAVDRLVEIWQGELDFKRAAERLRAGPTRAQRLIRRMTPTRMLGGKMHEFDPTTHDPAVILPKLLELKTQQAYGLTAYGDLDRSAALLAEIEELMPTPRHPLRFGLLQSRALASFHLGRMEDVRRRADEMAQLIDAAPEPPPPPVLFAYFVVCYLRGIAEAWGGFAITAAYEQRAKAVAERAKSVTLAAYTIMPRVTEAIEHGDADRLEPLAAEAELYLQRLGWPELGITRLRGGLPHYYAHRGDSVLAEAHAESLLRISRRVQDRWTELYSRISLALNAAEQAIESDVPERIAAADAQLVAIGADATAARAGRLFLVLAARVDLLRRTGQAEHAREVAAILQARVADPELACPRLEAVTCRAVGAGLPGDAGDALLAKALDCAVASGNPLELAVTLTVVAARNAATNAAQARRDLARAEELVTRLRNPLWLARIGRLRAVHGL